MVAVVTLVIGGMVWRRPRPHEPEPVYQGQPQSAWINSLQGGIVGIDNEHTWQSLFTEDEVTILIKALEARDTRSQKVYRAVWHKLPSALRRRPLPYPAQSAEDAHVTAAVIIGFLREDAQSAIPALIRVLQQDDMEFARRRAVMALPEIGPRDKRVVTALREALNDRSPKVREAATNALAQMSPRVRSMK